MSTDTTKAAFHEASALPDGYELLVMPTSENLSVTSMDPNLPLRPQSDVVILAVDPFSWAAVLKYALAEVKKAILGAVIKAFLGAIFGKKIDLERLLRDLLVEFAQLVRQILREEAIREARANTEAIQELMQTYAANSDFNAGLLNSLTVETSKNVSQLKSLGAAATGAWAIASTVEIVISLERFSRSRADGDWNTVIRKVGQFETHIAEIDRELEKQTAARFTAVSNRWFPGHGKRPDGPPDEIPIYFYDLDGQRYDWFKTFGDAERARANHVAALTRDLKAKVIAPVAALANEARKVVKSKPAP